MIIIIVELVLPKEYVVSDNKLISVYGSMALPVS